MCGRLNVSDDPFVHGLLEALDINTDLVKPIWGRYLRSGSQISIVRDGKNGHELIDASWWLLQIKKNACFEPNWQWVSFNTNSKRLHDPRSAGYKPFQHARCIIPVTGFGETEGKGKLAQYYDFSGTDKALPLGGIYKEWKHEQTGERVYSCSVITLKPHPDMARYHSKAMPLILPYDPATLSLWLDASFHRVDAFHDLLSPSIPQDLLVWKIDNPSSYKPLDDKVWVPKSSIYPSV